MARRRGVMVYLGHDIEMVRQMARIDGVSVSAWIAGATRRVMRERRRLMGVENNPELHGKGTY